MELRQISKNDYNEVNNLIIEAFTNSDHGYGDEAELVTKIRTIPSYDESFEIVATSNNRIVGHGLLSESVVHEKLNNKKYLGLVLAPISVLPNDQRQGIGTKIIAELEKRAEKSDYLFISILGDPSYYGQFGYEAADKYNINCPIDVPPEYFMVKFINLSRTQNISGELIYNEAFN